MRGARGSVLFEALATLLPGLVAISFVFELLRRNGEEALLATAACRYLRAYRWNGVAAAEHELRVLARGAGREGSPRYLQSLRRLVERRTGSGFRAVIERRMAPLFSFRYSAGQKRQFRWEQTCGSP